jgi:YHYH protein
MSMRRLNECAILLGGFLVTIYPGIAEAGNDAPRLNMSLRIPPQRPCISLAKDYSRRQAPSRLLRSCFGVRIVRNGSTALLVGSGVPNHPVTWRGRASKVQVCEQDWRLELPSKPVWSQKARKLVSGEPLGVALNGVPIYPAMHAQNRTIQDASSAQPEVQCDGTVDEELSSWRYVHPQLACSHMANSTDVIGFALDGFPIYGSLLNTLRHRKAHLRRYHELELFVLILSGHVLIILFVVYLQIPRSVRFEDEEGG